MANVRLLGWTMLLLFVATGMLAYGADVALHLNPAPLDGTFHLLNPMRRISLGQAGGIDYQNYHGLVLPYVFYPAFRLGGSTVFAAELARQLYTPAALILGYIAIFAALTRSARRTVRLTALALLATMVFRLASLLTPGSSEFGIRTLPALLFAAMLAMPSVRHRRLRAATEGIGLGFIVAMTTEQGLAVVASYAAVFGIQAVCDVRRRERVVRLLLVLGIALLSFCATLLLIGGPRGFINAVAYNFGSVSKDQFWYFGALPSAFLAHWGQFVDRADITIALLAGLANAVVWTRRVARRRPVRPPRATAIAFLSVYGLVSAAALLARWVGGYTDNTVRVLIVTALLAIDWRAIRRTAKTRVPRHWSAATAVSLAFAAIVASPTYAATVVGSSAHLWIVHLSGRLGPTLAEPWRQTLTTGQAVMDSSRQRTGTTPTIWSTYSSLLEATNGVVNPSFDYIIDALGPANREAYIETFRRSRPQIVQTLSPTYTTFEEWIEVTSWELYRELLLDYRVAAVGPWSVFWERLPSPGATEMPLRSWRQPAGTPAPAVSFTLANAMDAVVFDVEVDYEISNPWRRVPLAGKMPRFLIDVKGGMNAIPIPLAPYGHTARFPIVANGVKAIVLEPRVESLLPGASLVIRAVRIGVVPVTNLTLPWLRLYARAAAFPKRY